MHIVMNRHISGTRNGVEWPPRGGLLEVGDTEGADLIAAGHARHATEEDLHATEDQTAAGGSDQAPAENGDQGTAGNADGQADVDPVEALRAQAEELGIKVDKRMKAETIEAKIAEAAADGDQAPAEGA